MSKDYLRFFYILLIALMIGLIFDHVFAVLFFTTLACLIWQQQKISQLLRWLQNRKTTVAPEVPGHFEDICREIDRFQLRYKKRKKKLSGYLQQFHQATSALPDATIVLDDENRIQWANKAAEGFLNIHWPQDQRQRITNLIRSPELVRYLEANDQDRKNTVEIISPRNPELHLSLRIVPYGKDQHLFVARDVTQLQKLIEVRKDFVANVSHELRTPLTVLRGYLESMLQSNQKYPKQWLSALEDMSQQTERMNDVISDLLTISRLEENQLVPQHEIVIVPEMIGKIHEEAVNLSGTKQHLFEISVEPNLWIKGSSSEIYTAFSNLVFNAVRYTDNGGLIRIHWYSDKDRNAYMEITDNGIGIPPNDIPRLTERFYRVEQSRSRDNGGSGLGLSIVKHVLSRHKSTLEIESTLGEGSTFRCVFPKEIVVSDPVKDVDQPAG